MKTRYCALVLLLLIPSVVCAAPTLTKIPANNLGTILKQSPGNGTALSTVVSLTSDISPSVATASAILSVPLYSYSPLAGAAGQYALGYTLQAGVNLMDAYNQGRLNGENFFNSIIYNLWPEHQTIRSPQVGDILQQPLSCGGSNVLVTKTESGGGYCDPHTNQNCPPATRCDPDGIVYYTETSRPYYLYYTYIKVFTQLTNSPVNYPPPNGPPSQITFEQAQQLAQKIAEAAQNSQQSFKDAAENLLKKYPDLVPNVNNITNEQVKNWAIAHNYTTNQEYIDYLTNIYNSTTGDTHINAGIDLEKAKAEQEKEQTEEAKETFSPISDNPFTEPYNPGEYDIPARFATFLNRVKSTGLFSFSAGFFNSLPGGGSPIYEIEAGQYGHHTIDLSQTLTVGLAVLKTILLACFGFLSIRAVIMKR